MRLRADLHDDSTHTRIMMIPRRQLEFIDDRYRLSAQPVDATHALNLSAGFQILMSYVVLYLTDVPRH